MSALSCSTQELIWRVLEQNASLSAVPAVWRRLLGDGFDAFRTAFLREAVQPVAVYPCFDCGCFHRVIEDPLAPRDASVCQPLVAVCDCECCCPDIPLARGDLMPLSPSWRHLTHAIARAFECDLRDCEFAFPHTRQIGAFGGAALPVILVIQDSRAAFHNAITHIVSRLGRPFIAIAPTTRFMDAMAFDLLGKKGAAFFDLASHTVLTGNGVLHTRRSAAELLAPYLPERTTDDEGTARNLFALLQRFEAGAHLHEPSALKVFRLYCVEALTAEQVARRCRCSKGTIINRLRGIRQATGLEPEALRRFSDHFSALDSQLQDPRARKIWRNGLTSA